MSGYAGNPDLESEHALILAENGIAAARAMLGSGESLKYCLDCGDEIPAKRREVVRGCRYCVVCQEDHDYKPQVKMLTKML